MQEQKKGYRYQDPRGVIRDPIDKVAFNVIKPAPWWAHCTPEPKYKKTEEKKQMSDAFKEGKVPDFYAEPNGKAKISEKALELQIVGKMADKFEKNVVDTESMVQRAQAACDAVEYMASHMQMNWTEYLDWVKKALEDSRMHKMAIESENRQILQGMKDIRQFLLDPKHEEEMKRLKDFLDTCDRLKKLKDSGFLDQVCDVLLKVNQ